jgi:hypothetical protein
MWELNSGRELRILSPHFISVYLAAVTPGVKRGVFVASAWTLKVLDLDTGDALATFTCDGVARCCAYSDALKLIVAGDAGGYLHFLRLEEPKPKRTP